MTKPKLHLPDNHFINDYILRRYEDVQTFADLVDFYHYCLNEAEKSTNIVRRKAHAFAAFLISLSL